MPNASLSPPPQVVEHGVVKRKLAWDVVAVSVSF